MYCKNCGSQLSLGDLFCKECGQPVSNVEQPTEAPKLSRRKKGRIVPKILIGVGVLFGLLVVIGFVSDTPVSNTKAIVFDHYGDIPIGEAAEANLDGVNWNSKENGDGSYTVTIRGVYPDFNAFVGIDFNYTESDDYCWAISERAYMNGEYFYDDIAISMVMAMIYGNDDMIASSVIWSMLG